MNEQEQLWVELDEQSSELFSGGNETVFAVVLTPNGFEEIPGKGKGLQVAAEVGGENGVIFAEGAY